MRKCKNLKKGQGLIHRKIEDPRPPKFTSRNHISVTFSSHAFEHIDFIIVKKTLDFHNTFTSLFCKIHVLKLQKKQRGLRSIKAIRKHPKSKHKYLLIATANSTPKKKKNERWFANRLAPREEAPLPCPFRECIMPSR